MRGIRSPPHFVSVVEASSIVYAKNHHRHGHVNDRENNAKLAIGNKRENGGDEQGDYEAKRHVRSVLLKQKLAYRRRRFAASRCTRCG